MAAPVYAGDLSVTNFGGGLNTQDSPATIDNAQAQDLLNVNFSPGGTAVYKRDGYGLFQTLPIGCSTCSVHGGHHFQQTAGNDVQLWGNDIELAASVNDGAFVQVSSNTISATWQCADSQGSAYCFTSAGDVPIKTDGTKLGTSYQPVIPSGTMATFTPLQLVVAGVAGNLSTLYVSAQNNFLNFTVGTLASSSFTEPIASPGSRITHIAYYFGKLFWWKDQSFGYATFTNQNDWQLTIVSNQVGTLDNSDAFWNSSGFDNGSKFTGTAQATAEKSPGGIFFRGQDNHIYVYDGYYLTRLTRIIAPTVVSANREKASSWTQTAALDFAGGSNLNVDTTTVPGSLVLISTQDSFGVDLSMWNTSTSTCAWVRDTVNGEIYTSNYLGGTPCALAELAPIQQANSPNFMLVDIFDFTPFTAGSSAAQAAFVNSSGNGYCLRAVSGAGGSIQAGKITSTNACGTSVNVPISTMTSTAHHSMAMTYSAQGVAKIYLDNIFQGTFTDTTYSGLNKVVIGGACPNNTEQCTKDGFKHDLISESVSTGTYYSAINNAPNLTTWGTLAINDATVGASTITYFTRSSTNSFTLTSSTPVWVTQSKNANVTASTGTFFQLRADFSITAATESPSVADFTFNWTEGASSDKAYLTYFNDAVWCAVSYSSASVTNNRVFYWDILNGAWSIYDIPSNGFLVENSTLYFGDPVQGRIFKFGGVTTDNGSAINSYWRSKSFLAATDPFVQNQYVQSDFVMAAASTTVNYTYTLDSKTATVFAMTTYDSSASLIQRNFLLPIGKIGKYYDFKIGNNDTMAPWRMMAHRVHFDALNWKPVLQ